MSEFKYNQDDQRRIEIINPDLLENGQIQSYNDLLPFDSLTKEQLQKLIDEKFANPNEAQNDAPSNQEFLSFMNEHPDFVVEGYAVNKRREDYRVSITAIKHKDGRIEASDITAFKNFVRNADEIDTITGYAWFD